MSTEPNGVHLTPAQVDEFFASALKLDTLDLYALGMLLLSEAGKRLISDQASPRQLAAGAIIASRVIDIGRTIGKFSSLYQ